ncbi:MAG: hypothetical protein C4297_08955 [Gemmataceae bacterium]
MKLKALVVDDSKVMRAMIMQALAKAHLGEFEFVEASDGLEALGRFNLAETDICFVDWNMPNMNGLEFVRQVRSITVDPIPVVMITSERTMGKMEQALNEAGATAYICKPFTAEELRYKLAHIVEGIRARKATHKSSFFSRLFG